MSDADKSDHLELLRQQTTLARFGELALRSDDLDEILTEACRLVGEALGTDLAKVVELQEDGQTLLVRAGVGWKPGVVGEVTIKAADDTSEGLALRTGEPMISPDIATETRFKYPPFLTDNGVRAVANVIIIGGQGRPPFGILQVDSREPRQFTDERHGFSAQLRQPVRGGGGPPAHDRRRMRFDGQRGAGSEGGRAHPRADRGERQAAGRGRGARAGRGGAAPVAQDGGGRPADRRAGARLQQPAGGHLRQPRADAHARGPGTHGGARALHRDRA